MGPRKTKCGIISFVSNFLEFSQNTEAIFRNSDRRTDIEKWYLTLVTSMMDNIPRIAKEHQKTPQAVVKMENFHHLHASLSRLKIPVLDSLKRVHQAVQVHRGLTREVLSRGPDISRLHN